LEQAIEDVSQIRMELGSFQKHTIERTMSNLGVAVENITEGQSVIEDADMAAKISDMASGQILAASSQAVLAHANQKPQAVLNLLHSS
jgi:flagellin